MKPNHSLVDKQFEKNLIKKFLEELEEHTYMSIRIAGVYFDED